MILEAFESLTARQGLGERLPAPGEVLRLGDLPGAAAAGVAAALLGGGEELVVLVGTSPREAETLHADLETILGSGGVRTFPQREALPYEDTDPHVEISGQRVETLAALLAGRVRALVVTARSLVERDPVGRGDAGLALALEEGERIQRQTLVASLEAMGFERTEIVRELGEFAVRGGILDVFAFGHELPLRIELWGDEIASLRRFELLTQRSVGRESRSEILPIALGAPGSASGDAERTSLLDLLPHRALLFELAPSAGRTQRRRLWEEIVEARRGAPPGELAAPDRLVVPPAEAEERIAAARRLEARRISLREKHPDRQSEPCLDLEIHLPPDIDRHMDRLAEVVADRRTRDLRTLILCDNSGQLERLEEILSEIGGQVLGTGLGLAVGSLSGGFQIPEPGGLLVLTDHEIFRRSPRLRRSRRFHGVATLESIASLTPGDYVVHMDHGIGRYLGLERVEAAGEAIETLKIEYAEGEILRVPHYRLDLVERYSGIGEGDGAAPRPIVHRLGGKRWRALKRRTEESIRAMAAELIELYAHRRVVPGFAFTPDTRWQRELESSFLYEDTADQRAAWEDVRSDMESPRIMDRLICGDVGYGKTEIAIRAAFKAVQDSRQVAVLAPTTILVEQHLHTFRERLAGFPVRVEALSRLRSAAEQRAVLADLAKGGVDVLIGTHRLLSQDVSFRELGLLVVDEEQRFGVRHKERLKEIKRTVDVLSLTATPIPRTLQLALGGMRDLSRIETPPRDRMPVITHVLSWSGPILRDAMRREIDRGGQVFFVHDRVETIDALAERVRGLVPEARIAIAHGRLPERKLGRAMDALMAHEIDVLVCTSIIENGLDVAAANTMIVHRADRFGLAQLYQLRGRVGRSHHRAYCYFLAPATATPDSLRRLRVLEHHTELGSGYRVALKDLELRGAGNLLGVSQSGFAGAVGFDTYQTLLARTVRRLRGEETEEATAAQVSVQGEAFLPDDYIAGSEQKMHLYRRLSRATTGEEIEALREELKDRFGEPPPPAERLLLSVWLKRLGGLLAIQRIRVTDRDARIHFRPDAVPRLARLRNAFEDRQIVVEVRRAQPLSLVLERAGVEPLGPTLVDVLRLLAAAPART